MNKPSIRNKGYTNENGKFQAFTDDWKQRSFSEITYPSGTRNKENLPLETYSITNDRGFLPQSEAHDDFGYMQNADKRAYIVVTPDSFGYNPARINVGSIGYYEGEENVIVSSLYEIFKTQEYIDNHFLMHWFKSDIFPKWIEKLQEGSVRLYFYYDKLCECNLTFPMIEEQRKIAALIDTLDETITLHQRELHKLNNMKTGFLQKLFPQGDATVPEIRFNGYTDKQGVYHKFNNEWEQRRLGDLVDRVTRKNSNNESELPLTISAQYGLIDQMEFFGKRIASRDISGYYLLYKGEFAYNKSTSSDAPWGAVKRLDRYENGAVSTLYITFAIKDTEHIDSDFLVYYYDTDLWYKGVQAIAAEGARNHGLLNIAPADYFNTTLMVPTDIEEQKAIGSMLSKVDTLITLQQRKLDILKRLKTGFLQKMFV